MQTACAETTRQAQMTELAQVGTVSDEPLSSIDDTSADAMTGGLVELGQRKSTESLELLTLKVDEEEELPSARTLRQINGAQPGHRTQRQAPLSGQIPRVRDARRFDDRKQTEIALVDGSASKQMADQPSKAQPVALSPRATVQPRVLFVDDSRAHTNQREEEPFERSGRLSKRFTRKDGASDGLFSPTHTGKQARRQL